MKFRDLSGQRFGRLTVTKRAEDHMDGDRKRVMFSCICDCGERHLTRAYSLLSGHVQSCGCLRIELLKTNPQIKKATDPVILQQRKDRRNLLAYIKHLRVQYGLNYEDFLVMLLMQDNKCGICGEEMVVPHVDHDHITSKTRELLCNQCNHLLGNSKESIEILEKAIQYLRRHHGK